MNKKTSYLTFCAVVSSLISVLMITSYFPYLTYAIPAVAGAFVILPLVELSKGYALLTYIASSLLVLFFSEPEAKLMYICFFGYYPVLKAVYEKIRSRAIEYILKLVTFNGAVTLVYVALAKLFDIDLEGVGEYGKYGIVFLYSLGNIAFVLYDVCLSRLCSFYIYRLHEKIKKIMRF